MKRKGEADALFSGLLEKIRLNFPRSANSDKALDTLSKVITLATTSKPPTDGPKDRETWAQEQADQFGKLLQKYLKDPGEYLSRHMEENIH